MSDSPRPGSIGVMDSGVGGLSVLPHVWNLLPQEKLIYFADQAHVPYGRRPATEVREVCEGITRFLLGQGARLVVVACNTASAAALAHLRKNFPAVPFVGMEPAVKPGASSTKEGKIGILATAGTFGSERYANLMARYASGVLAFEDPCDGLVEQIEAGLLDSPETAEILRQAIEPMLAAGVDTLVLGCTHYPLVLNLIRRLVGPDIAIIDPAPAVARQVKRVWRQTEQERGLATSGSVKLYTTGNPHLLAAMSEGLLGNAHPTTGVSWKHETLSAPEIVPAV